MTDLSKSLESLSPEQKASLLKDLVDRKRKELDNLNIPRLARSGHGFSCSLSFTQQHLWFLHQLAQDNPFYNMFLAMSIQGPFDIDILQDCLREVIRRHEILRTKIDVIDGEPRQVILPDSALPLSFFRLHLFNASEGVADTHKIISNEIRRPFTLSKGSLMRVTLIKVKEEMHILLFVIHHIISDNWSMKILLEELATLYNAFRAGRPSPLAELSIQYADYTVWQQQRFHGATLKNQIGYWKQFLANAPSTVRLPTDHVRPFFPNFIGAVHRFRLPAELSLSLKKLCQRESTTLYTLLLAAIIVFLFRYTSQRDLLVGTPFTGRNRTEIEPLIGFFVNTLVIRTKLSGDETFIEVLKIVRETVLDVHSHQDIPFARIVKELQPDRNLSYNPLFQVMFDVRSALLSNTEFAGTTVNSIELDNGTAKFDLSLTIDDEGATIRASMEYSTEIFVSDTIKRMANNFQVLLESIVITPNETISKLNLLTKREKYQLVVEWNHITTDYPRDQCIHHLFETQVRLTPDALAVTFPATHESGEDRVGLGQSLTYRELNSRANQLAHYLRARGVEPEVPVSLCVERSIDMVVGILGILKAGGAYVPLDLAYPKERLAFILEDTWAPVLVTETKLLEQLPQHQAKVVSLDADWELISTESPENPIDGARPDNLAYVIYTSGSTGKPKGVLVSHHNVVRLFEATHPWFHFDERDVWTLFHSYAFDFSVWELWGAILYGGRLVVVPYWMSRSPEAFYGLLRREQVTVLNQTPSAFRQLVRAEESLGSADDLALRLIIFGGEALDFTSLKPWFDRHGDQIPQLVNMYGITETTVHVTYRPLAITDLSDPTGSLIGKSIPDLQVYILDEHMQPVPIGAPGELYVGGAGVARGYLNRPELTAERFVSDPFGDQPGARLYRTGDLARYLPNGDIEYLGRIDNQVKIRGFRIELREIEEALMQHFKVKNAAVLAYGTTPGGKQLVAYVVGVSPGSVLPSELRHYLRRKLPGFMIPTNYVFLDALPLTTNGKVDRQALPAPEQLKQRPEGTFVPPRTDTEKKLAEIWANVLNVDRVGNDDNFFDIGGHSLQITQLLPDIRDSFQIELRVSSLFNSPTVGALAKIIDTAKLRGDGAINATYPTPDLEAEVVLGAAIRPPANYSTKTTQPTTAILLTGATGFLGAFLLRELLERSSAYVYCLTRSPDANTGAARIRNNLERYLLWDNTLSNRIIPVVGDLSQPFFDLSYDQFHDLATRIDTIYHNGAWVNFLLPYTKLKATNVLGTQEILRLATLDKIKPTHYISTLSVLPSLKFNNGKIVYETDPLGSFDGLVNGYNQSKWVAEKLVRLAQVRGVPVCIYRPGRITGHSQTGKSNLEDFLYKFVLACIELGLAPQMDGSVQVTPVDYVTKAIVALSQKQDSIGKVFHVNNPHQMSWTALADWLSSNGYILDQVPYFFWKEELAKHLADDADDNIRGILPLLPVEAPKWSDMPRVDCTNTIAGLRDTEIACPPADVALLDIYFSNLRKS